MGFRLLFIAASATWILIMGILIEREVLPLHFGDSQPTGYAAYLAGIEKTRRTRMAIFVRDLEARTLIRVGTVETEIAPEVDGNYRISTESQFHPGAAANEVGPGLAAAMSALSGDLDFEIRVEYVIGPDFRPRTIRIQVESPFFTLNTYGVAEGDSVHMTTRMGSEVIEETLDASEHPFFSSDFAPLEIPADLHVGKTWQVVRHDPFQPSLRQVHDARVTATYEDFEWEGTQVRVHEVVVTDRKTKFETRCFVRASDRVVLEQDLPYANLVMRLERLGDDRDP